MTPKNKSIMMILITSLLAIFVFIKGVGVFTNQVFFLAWVFFSWNFFAYGFNKSMWPWIFDELKGGGLGRAGVREFHFWGTAVMYLGLLAMVAFGD
jgi:hypothetical protein